MRTWIALGSITGLALFLTGCDAALAVAGAVAGSPNITVRLVNASPDFRVDGTLFYGDDQNVISEALVREFGTERTFDVGPGEVTSFSRDCSDLEVIFIDDADLRVTIGVSPDDSTRVFIDGIDFDCGDILVFTFSHDDVDIPTTLNLTFRTEQPSN